MRVKNYFGTKSRYLSAGAKLNDEVGRSRKRITHLIANQWDDGHDGDRHREHGWLGDRRNWKGYRRFQWRASIDAAPPIRRVVELDD